MTWWNQVQEAPSPPPPLIPEGESPASVVTPDQYKNEFGSLIPQAVLDQATEDLESELKRPLRNAVWTHRVRIFYDGYVDAVFGAAGSGYPPAIPIQHIYNPAGVVIIDNVECRYLPPDDIMLGFWGTTWVEQWGTVQYQGGWTPETLPAELRTVIMKVANRRVARSSGTGMDVPFPGVENPKVGDVGYTTGPGIGGWFDEDDKRVIKKYVYRQV